MFAITAFLSSSLVYNTFGALDEKAIERLSFIARMKQFFRIRNNQRADPNHVLHEMSKYFPQFTWLLRDFSLELFDEEQNRHISPQEYLETALLVPPTSKDSEQLKIKTQIRDSIRDFFKERACFVLPRPVSDEKLLRNIEELTYDALKPTFREGLEDLISYLRATIKPKVVNNVAVDGHGFVKLIESLAASINQNSLPTLATTWDRIVESEMKEILQKAFLRFQTELARIESMLPMEESEIYKLLFNIK